MLSVLIVFGCKEKFHDSTWDKGAMFVVDWHYKFREYPSYWAREKAFDNPGLSIDSIRVLEQALPKYIKSPRRSAGGIDSVTITEDMYQIYYVDTVIFEGAKKK